MERFLWSATPTSGRSSSGSRTEYYYHQSHEWARTTSKVPSTYLLLGTYLTYLLSEELALIHVLLIAHLISEPQLQMRTHVTSRHLPPTAPRHHLPSPPPVTMTPRQASKRPDLTHSISVLNPNSFELAQQHEALATAKIPGTETCTVSVQGSREP